uniref:hypothetical protein n=1 Tax=uncultured Draconibacterium sp. TaxID=1573823 RepID=UPI003216210F
MEAVKQIQVEIGGKMRLVRFGLGATREVCKLHNLRLEELAAKLGIDALFQDEIYGGLVYALALDNNKPDFNYAQVLEWIDDMPQEAFQNLFDKWLLCNQHGTTRYEKFMKVLAANNPDASDEKKNLTGTTS